MIILFKKKKILTPWSLTVAISDSFKPPVNIALKYGLAADSITLDLIYLNNQIMIEGKKKTNTNVYTL